VVGRIAERSGGKNIFQEQKKGEARYLVESLFAVHPYVADVYKK